MKEFSFDAARFLGKSSNPADLYDRSSEGRLYTPLNLDVMELEKILLVSFRGDPLYREVELQSIGDDFGKGAVVLLYHKDGNVDVYYSNPAHFSSAMYVWGSNWHIAGQTDIEPRFSLTDHGVDAALKVTDRFGHVVELFIKENCHRRGLAHLLAPLGYDLQTDPIYFPFLYMRSCAPVHRDGTSIRISVDGEPRTASEIPVPIQGERKYHSRFSMDPFIGLWNRKTQGALSPLDAEAAAKNDPAADGITYTLAHNYGHPEIVQIQRRSEHHGISFRFAPPIPDLPCLRSGAKVNGRFTGGVDSNEGVMGGSYTIRRGGTRIGITLQPSKGWQPVPGKLWLKGYTWEADITVDGGDVTMDSSWTVKRKGLHEFFKHQ